MIDYDIPIALWLEVGGLIRPELGGSIYVSRPDAMHLSMSQIVVVCSSNHGLLRLDSKKFDDSEIRFRVRFEMANDVRTKNTIPR